MAVTAYFTATTGSDNNSGSSAGAVQASGTGAATTISVATVDLSADTPDLSSVPVGGTIRLNGRNDGIRGTDTFELTVVNDGADTVDVTPVPNSSTSGVTWAIGGDLLTISRAAALTDGNTTNIKSGTYPETIDLAIVGTALIPNVLIGYDTVVGVGTKESVKVDGAATRASGFTTSLGAVPTFWAFENIRCTDHTSHGWDLNGGADNFTYKRCRADNNGGNGFFSDNVNKFEDCEADNNTLDGIDVDNTSWIDSCLIHDNGVMGCDLQNGVVKNSLVYGNGSSQICFAAGVSQAFGNTVDGVDKTTTGIETIGGSFKDLQFSNNLLTRCATGIAVAQDGKELQIGKNNHFHDNTADETGFKTFTGKTTGDPQFVNQAGGDYNLKTNSPCIGAGADAGSGGMDSGALQTKFGFSRRDTA